MPRKMGRGDQCVAQIGSKRRTRKLEVKPNSQVMPVDEFFSLESIDPDFDKPPEFIEDLIGHRITSDEDY